MAETTNISWSDATLNFWVGCTKVSTGDKGACEFCYAETWAKRWPAYRDTWGAGAARILFQHLRAKARKLEKLALAKRAAGGGAFFCFSNSLSDIFDNEVPIEWLVEAFAIMREEAPTVTFLLLTKRAPNIIKRAKAAGGLPPNAAIGITVVTQEEVNRDVHHLLAAKRVLAPMFVFLSIEPMMSEIELWTASDSEGVDYLTGAWFEVDDPAQYAGSGGGGGRSSGVGPKVDWVIAGGESGTHARPSAVAWFQSLRDQCERAGVPFHFKQWGEWGVDPRREFPEAVFKIGKEAAGRTLDGVEHNARPEVAA